jgi:hypothetical protein
MGHIGLPSTGAVDFPWFSPSISSEPGRRLSVRRASVAIPLTGGFSWNSGSVRLRNHLVSYLLVF